MARPRKYPIAVYPARAVTNIADVPAPKPSCLACGHRHNNGAYDECRRYPPPFAVLSQSDWCGEFKAKA